MLPLESDTAIASRGGAHTVKAARLRGEHTHAAWGDAAGEVTWGDAAGDAAGEVTHLACLSRGQTRQVRETQHTQLAWGDAAGEGGT